MREHYPHRATIEDPLNMPGAAFIRHAHKRRDAGQKRGRAQPAYILDREHRVLLVDEDRVILGRLSEQYDLIARDDFDAESLDALLAMVSPFTVGND